MSIEDILKINFLKGSVLVKAEDIKPDELKMQYRINITDKNCSFYVVNKGLSLSTNPKIIDLNFDSSEINLKVEKESPLLVQLKRTTNMINSNAKYLFRINL